LPAGVSVYQGDRLCALRACVDWRPPESVDSGGMTAIGTLRPRADATACPLLAKAYAASPGRPSIVRSPSLTLRHSPTGRMAEPGKIRGASTYAAAPRVTL
jgi:hypothetical protein